MDSIKKLAFTLSAFGLMAFIGWFCFNYGLPWNYLETKAAFKQHLAQYDEDMVLDKIEYGLMHNRYTGLAYVKDNPELSFYIWESRRTGEIEDGYEFENTHTQSKQDIIKILDKYSPNRVSEGIEIVNLENRELEINMKVKNEVALDVKDAIVEAITEKGYVVDQLFISLAK